jgi:hypothetical protein
MAATRVWSLERAMAAVVLALIALVVVASTAPPARSTTDQMQTPAVRTTTALPRVDIYGDSVTWESEFFMVLALSNRANVHMHVYPGAQICQWFDDMRSTAALHPSMVIITEGVWGARDCDHTTNLFREAQDDAGTAAAIFSPARVVFAADPVVLNSTQFVQTMGSKNYPKVLAAFRKAARLHKNAMSIDAATSVAPKNTFVWTKPCLSNETAAMGCSNGRIRVRQPDGIHLCPVTPAQPGHCPMYSSGERRWAAAVTRPAVKAFPVRG